MKHATVVATQWFKNGDHPDDYAQYDNETLDQARRGDWEGRVVRQAPGSHTGKTCIYCGNHMNKHGWVRNTDGGQLVCPGDWVITGAPGEYTACKPGVFRDRYRELS